MGCSWPVGDVEPRLIPVLHGLTGDSQRTFMLYPAVGAITGGQERSCEWSLRSLETLSPPHSMHQHIVRQADILRGISGMVSSQATLLLLHVR